MSLDILERVEFSRRRRRNRLLVAVVVLATLLLALTFLAFALGDTGQPTSTSSPSAAHVEDVPAQQQGGPSDEVAIPSAPGTAAQPWVPPTHQVVLPSSTDQIEEFPVGFPQTPEGAAAAEVAKDRFSTTTDYQLANSVARVYLAPDLAATADKASTSTVQALRRKLGVPATGPPPMGTQVTARPTGVQWSVAAPDHTEVSVLLQVEYRTSDRAWTELAAATTVWQWIQGEDGRAADWRLVDARTPTAGLAHIGSQDFNDEGWAAIVTETAR